MPVVMNVERHEVEEAIAIARRILENYDSLDTSQGDGLSQKEAKAASKRLEKQYQKDKSPTRLRDWQAARILSELGDDLKPIVDDDGLEGVSKRDVLAFLNTLGKVELTRNTVHRRFIALTQDGSPVKQLVTTHAPVDTVRAVVRGGKQNLEDKLLILAVKISNRLRVKEVWELSKLKLPRAAKNDEKGITMVVEPHNVSRAINIAETLLKNYESIDTKRGDGLSRPEAEAAYWKLSEELARDRRAGFYSPTKRNNFEALEALVNRHLDLRAVVDDDRRVVVSKQDITFFIDTLKKVTFERCEVHEILAWGTGGYVTSQIFLDGRPVPLESARQSPEERLIMLAENLANPYSRIDDPEP